MKMKRQRQDEADFRQEQRDKLTPAEQIHILDQRLGKGVGAKKERTKLAKEGKRGK